MWLYQANLPSEIQGTTALSALDCLPRFASYILLSGPRHLCFLAYRNTQILLRLELYALRVLSDFFLLSSKELKSWLCEILGRQDRPFRVCDAYTSASPSTCVSGFFVVLDFTARHPSTSFSVAQERLWVSGSTTATQWPGDIINGVRILRLEVSSARFLSQLKGKTDSN